VRTHNSPSLRCASLSLGRCKKPSLNAETATIHGEGRVLPWSMATAATGRKVPRSGCEVKLCALVSKPVGAGRVPFPALQNGHAAVVEYLRAAQPAA
jgi:hypothetical protein